MPAQTPGHRHLHLVHPTEMLPLSMKKQLNLIRLRILKVVFVVWWKIHGLKAERDGVRVWNSENMCIGQQRVSQLLNLSPRMTTNKLLLCYAVWRQRTKWQSLALESTKIFFISEYCSLPVRAVIDPGSAHSFIRADVCEHFQLPIPPMTFFILAKEECSPKKAKPASFSVTFSVAQSLAWMYSHNMK